MFRAADRKVEVARHFWLGWSSHVIDTLKRFWMSNYESGDRKGSIGIMFIRFIMILHDVLLYLSFP